MKSPGKQLVTAKDIARAVGVSPATVSYVLSGCGREKGIGAETCKRVTDAAARLGYRPNTLAKGLRQGRSRLIGVLAPCVTFGYFSEIVRGAEDVASAHGYTVILMHSDEDAEKEARKIEVLRRYSVEGLLVIPAIVRGHDASFVALSGDHLPFVLVDKTVKGADCHFVGTDDRAGARTLVEHLIGLGHRRIAHLRGPRGISTSDERLAGYRDALRAAGIRFDPRWVAGDEWSEEAGRTATRQLLAVSPRPTAIFASTDLGAWGAYDVLVEAGLRVPRDVSLAGFADLALSARLAVPLTTVRQPAREVGRRAGEKLVNLIETGEDAPREVRLPTELVVRASTGRVCA